MFLDSLNKAVNRLVELSKGKLNVITIDSAQRNFAKDDVVKQEMVALVKTELGRFKAND